MKIIVDENIPYIRGRLEAVAEVEYVDQDEFTPELVKDADALLIRTRTRCNEKLLAGSRVSLVATATIGMDQIDREWCAKAGIEVANSPGCNAPAVAQYVWSALLRCGFDKSKHTLGIVGCGNVGGIVAEWARLMGVKILVCDPPRQRAGLPGEYASLDEVLTQSDAVTLHVPLTREGEDATYHLINEAAIGKMRQGALLINAARGPVVDFVALRNALQQKRIRAVIDTWEPEPALPADVLEMVEIGTFHIAGYSRQGKERATRMVIEAVERKFGVEVDKSGLEGAYVPPVALAPDEILRSYDPFADDAALRKSPAAFEQLRHDYHYREEVAFLNDILRGKKAALIDMDGVLYDSMKYHTVAWQRMMRELGVECPVEEFYLYEGMTGIATIDMLFRREFGHGCTPEEAAKLYEIKTKYFKDIGWNEPMPGADRMLKALERAGLRRVLVTGSSQANLLDSIKNDYPGAFMPGDRVTAADVKHGKPAPEPYLKGLEIAGVDAKQAIVIENAPLGVRAGKAAGIFTVAVTTGPIPRQAFIDEGADIIFDSMPAFADYLEKLH